MKKNVSTITKTEEIIAYEASDGTLFTNEGECKKYEETAECVIKTAYLAVPHTITTEIEPLGGW